MARAERAGPHDTRRLRLQSAFVFLTALALLATLEEIHRGEAKEGLYFQKYSSEQMMQTLSVLDLRNEPLRSLYYLHIQPPLLDLLRAGLACLSPAEGYSDLVRSVDRGLYAVLALAYAWLAVVLFRWLARLTSPAFALPASLLAALHPAFILFATYLDSTFLGALLVTLVIYELGRSGPKSGSVPRLSLAVMALFLTRSIAQYPFVAVIIVALLLRGVPLRRVGAFALASGLLIGAYTTKQYLVFGTTLTSTFAGINGCRSIDAGCDRGPLPEVPLPALPRADAAAVLSRARKPDGSVNYNSHEHLERSFARFALYERALAAQPLQRTLAAYGGNLALYLQPTSGYTAHAIVDRLPWRRLFDRVFSGSVFVVLLLAAAVALAASAWRRRTLTAALGLALPVVYVIAVCVLFESGENMRFKLFVEPVLCVCLATGVHHLASHLLRSRRERVAAAGTPTTAPERLTADGARRCAVLASGDPLRGPYEGSCLRRSSMRPSFEPPASGRHGSAHAWRDGLRQDAD